MSHFSSHSPQKRHLFYDQPRPFGNSLLHICKLFDGFFLGNQQAGKQQQFLNNNKISLIVNVAPEVHLTNTKNINVVCYDFKEKKVALEMGVALPKLLEIVAAMENCLRVKHQGVAIISKSIDSRATAFACLYLMIKFKWTLQEGLDYLRQRLPQLQIQTAYMNLLEGFASHQERDKLFQAFETESTAQEKELLKNTIQNSHVINMPDFHGLSFQKSVEAVTVRQTRKVKFKKEIQIINATPNQRKACHSASKEKTKLTIVENKLRQFIKEKCAIVKENSNTLFKPLGMDDDNENIVFIKSKDILSRMPRRRATSKAEQSPFSNKKQAFLREKSPAQDEFLFEFKEEDSLFKKSQPLKMMIPIDLQVKLTETEQEGLQSNRKQKNYIVHNSKRYRMPRKCFTEESVTSGYLESFNKPKIRNKNQIQQYNHNPMFKISKSSKTSSKKIKLTAQTFNTLGKESEKCMRIGESEAMDQDKGQEQYGHKVFNFNLNVQIQNINVFRERSLREDKKSKLFTRPHHSKKFSKTLSSISHNDS